MLSKVVIWLSAFACCMQLSFQLIRDTRCRTPGNAMGDCVNIYDCKPIINLLEWHWKQKKVVSEDLKIALRNHVCETGKGTKVCCPKVFNTPKTHNVTPTHTPVVNPGPTRPPPDVTPTPVTNPGPTTPSDTGCITPDNAYGDCVSIYDCKPIISLLELHKHKKVLSTGLKNTLKKYVCGIQKVCCPRVVKTAKTPLTPTLTLTRLDVTHRPVVNPPEPMPDPKNPQISESNLLLLDSCGLFHGDNRFSGWQMADLFEFPWMALLAYETNTGIQYKCGGSLINDRYVLTAAHCLTNLGNQKLAYVRLGEYDLRNKTDCETPLVGDTFCAGPTEDILAEEIIIHPEFDSVYYHNDIGLIRLQNNIERKDHISPICLPTVPDLRKKTSQNVILTGWGLTESHKRSDVLMKVEMSMVDQTKCRRIYSRSQLTDNQICAVGIGKKGFCSGDSGGPIQFKQVHLWDVRFVQHGVMSLGICGRQDFPGIYTRVDRYLDWIVKTVKP